MVELMEGTELTLDNNHHTTINDALRGLLSAEAAANSMVSIHSPSSPCKVVIMTSHRILMKLIWNCRINQLRRYYILLQ